MQTDVYPFESKTIVSYGDLNILSIILRKGILILHMNKGKTT